MANIKVIGSSIILQSNISYADIEYLQKYYPKGLAILDEENTEKFRIGVGTTPHASEYGILFNGMTRDEAGYATCTLALPEVDKVDEYVIDKYGDAILALDELEQILPERIDQVSEKRRNIRSYIEIF